MQLRQSERKQAKIKMALQGSSGCGKSLSSLLLAKGLTNDQLAKVAVIDTENGSADLYAHLGNYNVLPLQPPYTPEKFIEAIEVCEKAGMEVIILDSISQVWDELLDYHSKLPGNSFANWSKVTPRQKAFINKILQCDAHVIATMRTKQDYVLQQKDGKYIPEKVGLKAVQRDDVSYEFTIVFDIDIKHFATASKDRTNLFSGRPEFMINTSTGKRILEWCTSPIKEEDVEWLNIPKKIKPSEDLFACQVIGESMNKIIPNGALCLFKKYSGGSRNGKIVLVENNNMHDSDFGSCYTVKEYESKKYEDEGGWKHQSIILKPLSTDSSYENIILEDDDSTTFKVIGTFEGIIE